VLRQRPVRHQAHDLTTPTTSNLAPADGHKPREVARTPCILLYNRLVDRKPGQITGTVKRQESQARAYWFTWLSMFASVTRAKRARRSDRALYTVFDVRLPAVIIEFPTPPRCTGPEGVRFETEELVGLTGIDGFRGLRLV
jgi:hypothetical protein